MISTKYILLYINVCIPFAICSLNLYFRCRDKKCMHRGRNVCYQRKKKGNLAVNSTGFVHLILFVYVLQVATEKDFIDAINKVIKAYAKFSSTPRYMAYN